jgi:hypothetical protein
MDVTIAEHKAFVFDEQLTDQTARERALEKKIDAFGTMAKFLQRPKTEEIQLTYSEKRYESFWYVSAKATYIYERTQRYRIPITDPAVRHVQIGPEEYTPQKERDSTVLVVKGLERCEDVSEKTISLDGVTGEKKDFAAYLKYPASDVPDLSTFAPEKAMVVPPQVRITQVVRELIQSMLKAVQADTIQQEKVEILHVGLYFHPIYAFEYNWTTKDRKQIVEFDGLTGAMRTEGKALHQSIRKVIDNDLLFDLSAEAINLVVPGGAIAIKLARAVGKSVSGHG